MQPGDRAEFEGQLRTLFSGLRITAFDNQQQVAERVEAWWAGLQRMSLPLFVRCIEFLVANPWPDYLPKKREEVIPHDLWKVAKNLRGGSAEAAQGGANYIRNYWRSCIVHDAVQAFGYRGELVQFEELLIAHRDDLGQPLRDLLDELEVQDRRDGRTEGQHRYVQRRCEELAHAFPHLRSEHAQQLPPPPRQADQRLAGFQ